jgi:uncharacterized 2Fe-2S/4Fe-4S cluster protein (DUF4445 family)
MARAAITVRFEPQGREAVVLPGTPLTEAAAEAGLDIQTPCGKNGQCGQCRVRFAEGAPPANGNDHTHIPPQALAAGWRLACRAVVTGPACVHLPAHALAGDTHQIVVRESGHAQSVVWPPVRKVGVLLGAPSQGDTTPDQLRLLRAAGAVQTSLRLVQRLPAILRETGYAGTAVVDGERLIDFEAGDTSARLYGAAFDIGTTTLAASLVHLPTGAISGVRACLNPQVSVGDDVLSRIAASGTVEGLEALRAQVTGAINTLLDELVAEAGVSRMDVYQLTFAGNTTMEHVLCGIDPSSLGQMPFVPVFREAFDEEATALGVAVHPEARAYVFPVVAGFVGGDVVAGLLATGPGGATEPTLFLDIGTNGEIVLSAGGRLWAASTAAGPAFEGARIAAGMRAADGAIEAVSLAEGRLHCRVIGGGAPRGLCGSGLVDAVACLLEAGVIDPSGRLRGAEEAPGMISEALRSSLHDGAHGERSVTLAAAGGHEVTLTQRDIRELQLAKAAIRAGIEALLQHAGLTPGMLSEVRLAGGFGCYLNPASALRLGLLPPDIPVERVRSLGNTALSGARMALRCRAARSRAAAIARQALHVELAAQPDFDTAYALAMAFPENSEEGSTAA